MWRDWPEVLQNYAKHYQTGAPLPKELLDKVLAAERFNQGFKTTEYLAATLLDQAYHQLKPDEVPTDPIAFEAAALKRVGLDFAPVPPRYRSTYFSHSFSGGYSAGYYSYIWSEVLDSDSVEWIKKHGGLTRENGDRFRRTLLSRGGSDEALTLFKDFTGGPPTWPLAPTPRPRPRHALVRPGGERDRPALREVASRWMATSGRHYCAKRLESQALRAPNGARRSPSTSDPASPSSNNSSRHAHT